MSAIYAATYNGTITASGTDTDLGSFQPADDIPIRLRGFLLSQISEVGDSAEEGLRITVRRLPATFTVGSGGSSITATKPLNDFHGGTAWGMTARANDTTVATTNGTAEVLQETGWNERNSPFDFWYPDVSFSPNARQGCGIVVRQETTLADDMTGCFTFWIEELG
jgi:hypothetical protein